MVSVFYYWKAKDINSDPNYHIEIGSLDLTNRAGLALGVMALSAVCAIASVEKASRVVGFFRPSKESRDAIGHLARSKGLGDMKRPDGPLRPPRVDYDVNTGLPNSRASVKRQTELLERVSGSNFRPPVCADTVLATPSNQEMVETIQSLKNQPL